MIFPDEGSLVCGLMRLISLCDDSEVKVDQNVEDTKIDFEIVRIKNLMSSKSAFGCLSQSPLPTGYRHILVNICLRNGLLAGKFLTDIIRSYSRQALTHKYLF